MKKEDRNREIFLLRKKGATLRELATQYHLSVEWIRKICYSERKKEHVPSRTKKEKHQRMEETELYKMIVVEFGSKMQKGSRSNIPLSAYNCLLRQWSKDRKNPFEFPTIDYLRSLSDRDILLIPHVGQVKYEFLCTVRDCLNETKANRGGIDNG